MKVLLQPSALDPTNSLLSLYLSVYTAGCIQRKSKRIKNEVSLPKNVDLDEVVFSLGSSCEEPIDAEKT